MGMRTQRATSSSAGRSTKQKPNNHLMHIISPCLNLLSSSETNLYFLLSLFFLFFAKERNLKSKWMGIVELFLYQRYGILIAQLAWKRGWFACTIPFSIAI